MMFGACAHGCDTSWREDRKPLAFLGYGPRFRSTRFYQKIDEPPVLQIEPSPLCATSRRPYNMISLRVVFALVIVLLLAGCAGGADRGGPSVSEAKGVVITKAEYGEDWPYTVDSGRLYCDPPGSAVVMESDGKVYALNGRAMGQAAQRGYLNARETITLRDENGYFTIGDASSIIQRGLAMCE